MSNSTDQTITSSKKEENSAEKCEASVSVSTSSTNKDDVIRNEEMIKKAKRALLADAARLKQGNTPTNLKRRPPTSIVNTQFLGRLLNQPNRGRIVKPSNLKKTNSPSKNKKKT